MANTYKNIVITPNTGSTTGDPTIVFSGGDSTTNTDVTLRVYPTTNGTLSVEGSAGQLFSITNDLSNTIYSVNDISGLPLIEVNVISQQITFGQYYGNVGIGTNASVASNYKLDIIGGANISLPNLTVGGTNVVAAIVASNANAVTLSANVNTLAATFSAANANNISLSSNVNTLAATFVASNANTVSLSTNVNTLAASFVSNSQSLSANVNTLASTFASANANNISLSANVNTLAATFVAANANTVSLSTNVNVLAASFVSNSQSLSTNVNTLAATFVASNANTVSLSTNVNVLAASFVSNTVALSDNVNALAANTYLKSGGTISGDANITGNLTIKALVANGSLGTSEQILASNGSSTYWANNIATIAYTIDGGGADIDVGVAGVGVRPSFNCNIISVSVISGEVGNIAIDIWKTTFAGFPPVSANSIVASAKPTLTNGRTYEDFNLTGWTRTINAGDVLFFNVDSCSNIKSCLISLNVNKRN